IHNRKFRLRLRPKEQPPAPSDLKPHRQPSRWIMRKHFPEKHPLAYNNLNSAAYMIAAIDSRSLNAIRYASLSSLEAAALTWRWPHQQPGKVHLLATMQSRLRMAANRSPSGRDFIALRRKVNSRARPFPFWNCPAKN